MNKENTEALYDAYPALFHGRRKPLTQSLMAFGFECGDGWFQILNALSKAITESARRNGVDIPEVVQVKEKFGTLRFYLGAISSEISDEVERLIEDAEHDSAHTCEICGQPGQLRSDGGWMKTRCETHA